MGGAGPDGRHQLDPDPELGCDVMGRLWCRKCRSLGHPVDSRHTRAQPPPPTLPPELAQAAHARDNAILGERDD